MSRRGGKWGAAAVLLGVVLLAALLWWRWPGAHHPVARLAVRGGDGGGLPLDTPAEEHFDAAALGRVAADPAANGLQVLMVMRDGHVVFERFAHGMNADSVVDTGAFARVLLAMTAGIAAQQGAIAPNVLRGFDPARVRAALERGTHQSYVAYLSHRLWSRLNAGPAWIDLPARDAPPPVDCCFEARVQDWLRVGELLVNDGNFEDTQVLGRGWVARMRQPVSADLQQGMGVLLPSRRRGAAVYESNDVCLLRGPGHWRLWAMPSLQLVVLFGAADSGAPGGWDETRLPNLVVEALTARPAQKAQSLLQQLVPGH